MLLQVHVESEFRLASSRDVVKRQRLTLGRTRQPISVRARGISSSLVSILCTTLVARARSNWVLAADGRDLSVEHRLPPSKRRIRADRAKVRKVLLAGLDIKYDKRLSHFERVPAGGVRAFFLDGTSEEGTILVGADGNNSTGVWIRRLST